MRIVKRRADALGLVSDEHQELRGSPRADFRAEQDDAPAPASTPPVQVKVIARTTSGSQRRVVHLPEVTEGPEIEAALAFAADRATG